MDSMILRTASAFLVGLLAVLSVFMLVRGHDAPGGGFVGGLLLAAAVAIRQLSHGVDQARSLLGVDPRALIGIGLALVAISAGLGLVIAGPLLAPLEIGHLPPLGKIGTVFLFDLGVYVAVAGTAMTILLAVDPEAS